MGCDVNCPQLFSSASKMNSLQHKGDVDSIPHFTAQSPVSQEYNHATCFNFSSNKKYSTPCWVWYEFLGIFSKHTGVQLFLCVMQDLLQKRPIIRRKFCRNCRLNLWLYYTLVCQWGLKPDNFFCWNKMQWKPRTFFFSQIFPIILQELLKR